MNGIGPQDILRTQLMMGLGSAVGGKGALLNLIALNLYDKLVASYSVWSPAVKSFCCRRQKLSPSTVPPPTNKDVKCTIE